MSYSRKRSIPQGAQGQRLEFGLRAVADEGHARGRPSAGRCRAASADMAAGAQRRQQRHLGQEDRVAGVHLGQKSKGRNVCSPVLMRSPGGR
jgi:hypothetical protein